MNELLVQVRGMIQIFDGPLMLLSSHACGLDDLCKLLGERAEIVSEHTYSQEHNDVCNKQFIVVLGQNVSTANSHNRCSSPIEVVNVTY